MKRSFSSFVRKKMFLFQTEDHHKTSVRHLIDSFGSLSCRYYRALISVLLSTPELVPAETSIKILRLSFAHNNIQIYSKFDTALKYRK